LCGSLVGCLGELPCGDSGLFGLICQPMAFSGRFCGPAENSPG
jgi:hypothetical protein